MINIYVGNLPYIVTDQDLIDLFSRFGQINKATIVTDRESGRSKGFGFIEMADRVEGQNAISELAGNPFKGRPLTVNEARPRGSGTGERVLGDGSGGSAPQADHGRDAGGDDRLELRSDHSASDEAEAVPVSGGYRNTVLR